MSFRFEGATIRLEHSHICAQQNESVALSCDALSRHSQMKGVLESRHEDPKRRDQGEKAQGMLR